jgi:hypothetical protein
VLETICKAGRISTGYEALTPVLMKPVLNTNEITRTRGRTIEAMIEGRFFIFE